jgi:predicted TIM-barrel fold metal-dependent hydrolase
LRPLAAGRPDPRLDGLCLPGRTLFDLDATASLLDALLELGQPLFVHPGPAAPAPGAPLWWAPTVDYTAEMQAAYVSWLATGATRWSELPVVFAILAGGAPFQHERLESRGVNLRTLAAANVRLETASYGRLSLELCLAACGLDRIVFGSDAPVVDPANTSSAINALGKATADAIYRTNPAALLAA